MSLPRIEAVSVVICNYNGEEHLVHCLGAVRELAGPVDEVLLIDNASTDGGLALVERDFPEVRVVSSGGNFGPAAARNIGMREAKHRWVFALDNDAVPAPDVLTRLIAAAESREDVAIVQPRSVFSDDESRVHYDGGGFHYAGLIALENFYTPRAEAVGTGIVERDCAVSVGLLLDSECVLSIGGYLEEYFILFEDLDLSYRLRSMGKLILSEEDAILGHRGGTAGISFRKGNDYPRSRVFFHSRNRWLFLVRCYRWQTLVVASPGLALYEAVWFLFALLGGNLFGWIEGKAAFVQLLSATLRDRKAIQAKRTVSDRTLLVGGPLTTTPDVAQNSLRRSAVHLLDALLGAWWKLVKSLAG